MGVSGVRKLLKVRAVLPMAALALVLLVGVLLAKPAHAKSFTVNSTNHPGSGVCDAAECTLKEAINEANINAESDTIGFASGLGGEIELSNSSPEAGGFVIDNDTPAVDALDVRIKGPGGGLAIDGNGQAQVFVIAGATSQTSGAANAAIEGLTIKNGVAPGAASKGGGIFNAGTLTLSNSTVSGNTANYGGGIFNHNFRSTLTLTNSTVSGNTATNESGGGGIRNDDTLTVINSTLSGNSAPSGGGIYNGATATLKNTIVANSPGGNCGGGVTDGGHNLDSGTSCGFGTANNSLSDTDPMLGALADNGGPTLTHALLSGSPAINKGNSFGATTDQRGVARSQGAASDIGAFEVDTTAPKVGAATPTGTGIGRGTNLAATFSEAMDAATINRTTFKLIKAGSTNNVGAALAYNATSKTAVLNPNNNLAAGTRYKAVVTTGARDLTGNALDQKPGTAGNQQKTWTFTTKG